MATMRQSPVVIPTRGRHPIAKPSASVSARRSGETPVPSHAASCSFRDSNQLLIAISGITPVCQRRIEPQQIFDERINFATCDSGIKPFWNVLFATFGRLGRCEGGNFTLFRV